jgi:hypothetical protein
VALEQARGANARASEALLRSQTPEPGPRLLCVVFKRRPAAIREAVLDDPAFDSTRSALAQHNFPVELEGGGKVLTKPEHYEAGLEAMRLLGKRLEPNHVLVEEESYDDLIRAGAASASLIPLGDPPLLSWSAVVPPCAGSGIARRQRGLPDEDCYLGTAKEKAAVAHAKNRRASSICQSTFAKSSVSEYAASPYLNRTEPMSEFLCPTENVPAAIGSRPFTENPGMRGSHHKVQP